MADLWARQSIALLLSRAKEAETQGVLAHDGVPLKRTLTAINLVASASAPSSAPASSS
jgi:hypothetical protein